MIDLPPVVGLALLGLLLAGLPLGWVALRHRGAPPAARLRALTLATLFLTVDLVLFGAFTRLTDSGLGCPDWPGCYGTATPVAAREQIAAAQAAQPEGPVTHRKAWIEMTHRYLATAVGVLITALAIGHVVAGRRRWPGAAPRWALLTLTWVCLQGAFGALTVTMKLYPAIVTAHLLGGLALLALLAVQAERTRPDSGRTAAAWPAGLRGGGLVLAGLAVLQIALGGWVSTNYAVLACGEFPTCLGEWWPAMDFASGFTIARELGAGRDGGLLPFEALTAIHVAHRIGAAVVLTAITAFAWALHRSGDAALRRWAAAFAGVAVWQTASGLANVVLGWPLLAAVAHTAGAAALVLLLSTFVARAGRTGARHTVPETAETTTTTPWPLRPAP